MHFTYFKVTNYKGIEEVRIDLLSTPTSRIHTLIGLNESGKTTILEAINLIGYSDNLGALNLPGYVDYAPHELIPISKRSNFNGKIVIEAGVGLDEGDLDALSATLKQELELTAISMKPVFKMTTTYEFQLSQVVLGSPKTLWYTGFEAKQKGERKAKQIINGETWRVVSGHIRKMLPRVVYFPNFLFDFPDKIYLEPHPTDTEKHKFYKTVLQDVLDAVGEKTNIDEHVLKRAKSGREDDKRSLESVILKMGSHISQTVFKNWNRIFARPGVSPEQARKEIVVSIDQDAQGQWFVQLRLKDGIELYSISERSLGFRWFFAYLLLTQYRGFRLGASRNVVFMLDEPASNLHPSAQAQLLDSFEKLPQSCQIIYTTHSHHLIRPEWLEGAYVVKNEGLDYDKPEDDYSSRRTLVSLTRYRKFAAEHPDQTTYFQPVLDVLNYAPHRLENVPDVVMVEGKNDFYTLHFLQVALDARDRLSLLPGMGAGGLDDVIRLYIGWGRNFIVLLDSDGEAAKQKKRYLDKFGSLLDGRIYLLSEVLPEIGSAEMEDVFSESERLNIQQSSYPDTSRFSKTHFNRAIQEVTLAGRGFPPLSEETRSAGASLLDGLRNRVAGARTMLLSG